MVPLKARPNSTGSTSSKIERKKCAPMPARITLGDQANTDPRERKTFDTPAATAVLSIDPRFPGSWMFSSSRQLDGVHGIGPGCGVRTTAATPAALTSWEIRARRPSARTKRACAQLCEAVAAVRGVEVARGVRDEPRGRREASAAQHLMGAEPRLEIFAIRVAHEARIGTECAGRPLPDVAQHLAAAPEAVALGKSADWSAAVAAQIGECLTACELAPRIAPPRAIARKRGRYLPFLLARQAPLGVAAVRVRLMPVDVHHRKLFLELHPFVEGAFEPGAVLLRPIARRHGLRRFFPAPSFVRPPFAAPVAAFTHEFQELPVRDGGARDAKGPQLDRMHPFRESG